MYNSALSIEYVLCGSCFACMEILCPILVHVHCTCTVYAYVLYMSREYAFSHPAETAIEAIVTSTSDSPPPPPPRLASHEMSGPVESVDRPPLVIIASEEELGGEDAEITGAFSGEGERV